MKCVMCKGGELAPGKKTVKVQRGETLVIIKDVPADVCRVPGQDVRIFREGQRASSEVSAGES